MKHNYVHGYSKKQLIRLLDQARTLSGLLHQGTKYPAGSRVLEAGCGVGAQTVILARNSPGAYFTSVDVSEKSVRCAGRLIKKNRIANVELKQADILDLPFADGSFDHIFVCFVLEHLRAPGKGLRNLLRVLKKGGSITVIEGDHGSCFFHPETEAARLVWKCLVEIQEELGCDSLIGRRLFPLLKKAKLRRIQVSPRMVYVDRTVPEWVTGFIKKTIIAMVQGVRVQAIESGRIGEKAWRTGIRDLYRTASPGGTFCYTFFKGIAWK